MNVGCPTSNKINSSLSEGDNVGEDSIVLRINLVEVEPYTRSEKYSERILYSNIKVENLTPDFIRNLLLNQNVKKPNLMDLGEYLLFAYENHTPIFIRKSNGKIYGKGESYTEKVDAIRLLRLLDYYGLVEGFKRKQRRFTRNLWK